MEAEHPGRTWRRAPFALLCAYYTAVQERWGGERRGPSYVELDRLAAFRKRRGRGPAK